MASFQCYWPYGYPNEFSESKYIGMSPEMAHGQCQPYYNNNAMAGNPGQYYVHTQNPSHGCKYGHFHTRIPDQQVHLYGQTSGSSALTDQIHNQGHHAKHLVHKKAYEKKYMDGYGNVVDYNSGRESESDDEYYSEHGHGGGTRGL